jgi:hypothetical protein
MHRMGNKRVALYEVVSYPLIDARLTRQDCKRIIVDAGLPVPPKSACYFCPYKRLTEWARMRRDEPNLFAKSAYLEHTPNQRRAALGKDAVWLTRFAKPLPEAIHEAQPDLPLGGLDGGCDDGYCWT